MIATNVCELPSGDSPGLVLAPATPEERIAAIKLHSIDWKGSLDLGTYVQRENHLHGQRLAREGLTCWILVDRSEPEDHRTILSSCETYKKKALVAHNGHVEDISTHGIASVYCRPEFRRKGYAKRMLQELSQWLDTWKMEKEPRSRAPFTILFSDIGRNFYSQFGWLPFRSSHMSLPALPIIDIESGEDENGSIGELVKKSSSVTQDLCADDIENYMCSDTVLSKLRDRMCKESHTSPKARVAILPDFNHYAWHWAREEFFAKNILLRAQPVIKGVGNDEARVYCTWNRNFDEKPDDNVLYILRWVYDEPTAAAEEETLVQAMAAILRRAQHEAHSWGLSKVEFWNPSPLLQKAVKINDANAQVVNREKSSISSLRWTGEEQGLGNDVEWLLNEKYAWC